MLRARKSGRAAGPAAGGGVTRGLEWPWSLSGRVGLRMALGRETVAGLAGKAPTCADGSRQGASYWHLGGKPVQDLPERHCLS